MSAWCLISRCMAFLAVPLFLVVGCVTAGDEVKEQKGKNGDIRVGGACSYKSYEGTARIIRIEKTDVSLKQAGIIGGPGYEGYEIRFRFLPGEGIALEGWPAAAIDREHLLTLHNGWCPGPRFLEKYRLVAGNEYPCTLKIIETGTCTPIVFDFATIDTQNYFESRE
jgi:hypothetical protein